jgi:hypothetical protein
MDSIASLTDARRKYREEVAGLQRALEAARGELLMLRRRLDETSGG